MKKKQFKFICVIVSMVVLFASIGLAEESIALSASVRAEIEAQAKEMSAVGVPAEPARHMLTAMHQHQFTHENIVQAQHEVMNSAKAELPTEPVMNKAMEGMAKNANQQQVIAAMQTVRSRYAQARQMANKIAQDDQTVDALTHAIADSMAAGMKAGDMDAIALQLETRNRSRVRNKSAEDQLAVQTMQTTRTMARLGTLSKEVADTMCQALQNDYTHRQMQELRHQMVNQLHQMPPQKIARQHAQAIGKGGSQADGNQGGQGQGSGSGGVGSGNSGGGAGGSGAGGSGSGSGGHGNGAGGGGSGSGSGGSGD